MLYIIGIGLGNEKDISLNGLEVIRNCDAVYLENYTSKLMFKIEDLEKLTEKKIILAERELVENGDEILKNAKDKNTALLVKGDVFGATTHTDLYLRAVKQGIKTKIIHNTSILTAIGDTGLSLYKFGKTASIPFHYRNVKTPIEIYEKNKEMHTLLLLDLNPKENQYMNYKEGLKYLIDNSERKINQETKVIICAALGTEEQIIKYGIINELLEIEINVYPQCIIIPGKLHFMEEEVLELYKI